MLNYRGKLKAFLYVRFGTCGGLETVLPGLVFAGLRRGWLPASVGTKTSPGNTPEAKAGQRHQGRGAGNVRAGSLASPVERALGHFLGFLNNVKPQVVQEGQRTTQGLVWGTE
jgi:hypothetical protein